MGNQLHDVTIASAWIWRMEHFTLMLKLALSSLVLTGTCQSLLLAEIQRSLLRNRNAIALAIRGGVNIISGRSLLGHSLVPHFAFFAAGLMILPLRHMR